MSPSRRRNLLLLRWLAIIATGYLLLFSAWGSAPLPVVVAVLALLLSNAALHRLSEAVLFEERTLSGIALSDAVITATAVIASRAVPPRLLALYFFVMLMAAVGRSFAGSLLAAAAAALLVPFFVTAATPFDPQIALGVPFVLSTGAFYGYLASEVREDRSRELERARDAALEASRLKSAFLANVSHEIRTPVNVILGWIDAIDAGLDRPADAAAPRRAAERLVETIDAILNFSRIATGVFEIAPSPLRLTEVVERCAEDARLAAERKGLGFSCRIRENDAIVRFDEYCLSEAIRHLIGNAVKFTESGEISIELGREDDGTVFLLVSDTGVGIDPAYVSRLFEPFSQEERSTSKRFEGAGLGLAVARSLLVMNGARVDVESEKGRGARFTIRFPS